MKQIHIILIITLLFISCKNKDINKTENQVDKFLVVNASSLILREQPNKSSKQIITLFYGKALKIINVSEKTDEIDGITSKWYKVSTSDNIIGYAFGGYLKEPKTCESEKNLAHKDLLRFNLCKNIHNYYECSEVVEKSEIIKYPFIKRNGKELIIQLLNGKEIKYIDVIPKGKESDTGIKSYAFRDFIPSINYFIITAHFYEGTCDYLVNFKSGDNIKIWNSPVIISPDKKRVLVISGASAYGQSGVQIINIDGLLPFVEFEYKEISPTNAKWIDNQNIEVICRSSLAPGDMAFISGCFLFNIQIKQINNFWKLEK